MMLPAKKDYQGKSSLAELDILPFVRYYFPSTNTQTRLYGQLGGGIGVAISYKNSSESYSSSGTVTNKTTYHYPKKPIAFTGEALVGVNHFLSQNVALNAAIGYSYTHRKVSSYSEQTYLGYPTNSPEITNINSSNAFAWNVGFTMFIPCKKKK